MSRTIDPALWRDDFFASCTTFERLVWIGLLLTVADDQGRLLNNPLLIRADLFPMDDTPAKDIDQALQKYIQAGKLHPYEAGGKSLLQVVNWWRYQKASAWMSPSKHPAPVNWIDRARYHAAGNVITETNWKHPGGFNGHIPADLSPEPAPAAPVPTQKSDWIPSALPSALPSREGEGEGKGEGKGEGEGKRGHAAQLAPELALYRKVTKSLPTKPQFDFVAAYIRENQITEQALQNAWTLWTAKGYNPRNVQGVLEYAKAGRSIHGEENRMKTGVPVATRNAENLQIALEAVTNG